jgi:hypothetical protein
MSDAYYIALMRNCKFFVNSLLDQYLVGALVWQLLTKSIFQLDILRP